MAITLPLAAENYLTESGLTPAEMLVVKKLLEENRLTLRELSTKTGKGNSAMDAALKKLIQRGIVSKEKVNDQPRYTVLDPQSIVAWAERTLEERADMMKRRHQSFAQFIGSLNTEKTHPAVEHYEGEEGITRAFDRLLQHRSELLTYVDPAQLPDTASAQEFLQQYNRRRKVYGIFQRVIAPDTTAGRKFQSRDPFEYRKTVLIPQEEFPVSFTKIIAGDVTACIDIPNADASFIQFLKLADSERAAFEKVWEEQIQRHKDTTSNRSALDYMLNKPISLRSELRSMNNFQKICLGSYGVFFLYWLVLLIFNTKHSALNDFFNLFGLPPIIFGFVGMLSTKRWGGLKTEIGKAIFCIGLGALLGGLGSCLWLYYNFFLGILVPYPSILDAMYLPSIILFGLGIFFLSNATGAKHGLKNPYAKIFVILSPTLLLILSYYLFITVARDGILIAPEDSPIKTALDIAYPMIDYLDISIAVIISGLSFKYIKGMHALDIWIILLAMAIMFIGDLIFCFTTTTGTFYVGNIGDLAYVTSLFMICYGLLGFCRDKLVPLHS